MTNATKNAIDLMKKYNPYNEETGDTQSYNEIYDAMHTLACFGIISGKEWENIYKLDNKLFKEYTNL